MTSKKHNQLREIAITWLSDNGYNDIEIEVGIINPSNKTYKDKDYSKVIPCYFVDVVGRDGNKKIAIECGGCRTKKLNDLLGLFNQVWVLPYGCNIPYQWQEGMSICLNCGHLILNE